MFALVTPDAHIKREHKNVINQTVTYRPVWPAVSAPDFYCNVNLQFVFTDVTQIKTTYLLTYLLISKSANQFALVFTCLSLV